MKFPIFNIYIYTVCIHLKHKRYISWSRVQAVVHKSLSYTYSLHRYWKKICENFFYILTNIHKYKNINYSKILTAFEKMLKTQMH